FRLVRSGEFLEARTPEDIELMSLVDPRLQVPFPTVVAGGPPRRGREFRERSALAGCTLQVGHRYLDSFRTVPSNGVRLPRNRGGESKLLRLVDGRLRVRESDGRGAEHLRLIG